MSALAEHLRSPQFTDADGAPTGSSRVAFFVAPGRPRWFGYVFYLAAFVLSVVLALGVVDTGDEMGRDIIQIIGLVGAFGAIYGCSEVWRGRALSVREVVERLRRR